MSVHLILVFYFLVRNGILEHTMDLLLVLFIEYGLFVMYIITTQHAQNFAVLEMIFLDILNVILMETKSVWTVGWALNVIKPFVNKDAVMAHVTLLVNAGVPMVGRASFVTNVFRILGVNMVPVTDHHGNAFVI